jgi:prefoldin subunit 5
MKAVRTREEALDELRRRRRSLGSQADSAEKKLAKMGSEHKNLLVQTDQLNRLHSEIRALDSEIMSEEARVGDFKRDTTREWMTLKFGGLSEMGAKGMVGQVSRIKDTLMT